MRRLPHLEIDDHHASGPSSSQRPTSFLQQRPSPHSLRSTPPIHPPIPGRTRRKRLTESRHKHSFLYRLYAKWCRPVTKLGGGTSLGLAVLLWYALGVVSIGSSKILLMKHQDHFGNVPPLFLTVQQLFIGSSLLRMLLRLQFMGSPGIQPWPKRNTADDTSSTRYASVSRKNQSFRAVLLSAVENFQPHPSLVYAALYFTLGFLATNYGFSGSSAAFVETIKASEPITSASVAVWSGIETLSRQEASSLLVIVWGVLLSTVGNYNPHDTQHQGHVSSSISGSIVASLVVIASNLCFSFRGLHQKLFRATPDGNASVFDDLNLQFRMQQLGVLFLAIPVLLWDMPSILRSLWKIVWHVGLLRSGLLWRYLTLSLLNGCAFTSYNLASTFILTRISVVHHAALNCIRRIFAIIVTSFFFGVPITFTGAVGIVCSFAGFMAFSHYKAKRMSQPKPMSSLLPVSAAHTNHSNNNV